MAKTVAEVKIGLGGVPIGSFDEALFQIAQNDSDEERQAFGPLYRGFRQTFEALASAIPQLKNAKHDLKPESFEKGYRQLIEPAVLQFMESTNKAVLDLKGKVEQFDAQIRGQQSWQGGDVAEKTLGELKALEARRMLLDIDIDRRFLVLAENVEAGRGWILDAVEQSILELVPKARIDELRERDAEIRFPDLLGKKRDAEAFLEEAMARTVLAKQYIELVCDEVGASSFGLWDRRDFVECGTPLVFES